MLNPATWVRKNIYERIYLRDLEWIQSHFGGRASAGVVSRRARTVRLAINFMGIAVILTSILLVGGLSAGAFTSFWESGAGLRPWAVDLTLSFMAVNMCAVLIGTASNFVKIQQYTHAEVALQTWINEKRKAREEEPLKFPDPWQKRLMLFFRYLHDINGIAGSAISLYLCLTCILNFFSPGIMPISFNICALLFVVSRLSSLASVIFAPASNQYRIQYYKNNTFDLIQQYKHEHRLCNPDQDMAIRTILNQVFSHTAPQGKNTVDYIPKHEDLVYFACYRACEKFDAALLKEKSAILVKAISEGIKTHYTMRAQNPKMLNISVIEDTEVLMYELIETIKSHAANTSPRPLKPLEQTYPACLVLAAIQEKTTPGNENQVANNISKSGFFVRYKDKGLQLNEKAIHQAFPLDDPHGDLLNPHVHSKMIAERICAPPA